MVSPMSPNFVPFNSIILDNSDCQINKNSITESTIKSPERTVSHQPRALPWLTIRELELRPVRAKAYNRLFQADSNIDLLTEDIDCHIAKAYS